MDDSGKTMPFTSYGPDTDLTSIGGKVQIRCTDNKGWCVGDGGTSYATSVASASAALVWSAHPDWTANQVARVLIQTAGAPIDGSKRSNALGYGTVRPRKVLLDREGDPGAPDADPLSAPAPAKAPTPTADPPAAAPRREETADAQSGEASWQWPALGAVVVVSLGLGLGVTMLLKRRRR